MEKEGREEKQEIIGEVRKTMLGREEKDFVVQIRYQKRWKRDE